MTEFKVLFGRFLSNVVSWPCPLLCDLHNCVYLERHTGFALIRIFLNNSTKNVAKVVRLITNNDDPFSEVNDPILEKDFKRTVLQKAQVKPQVYLYLRSVHNQFSLGPFR